MFSLGESWSEFCTDEEIQTSKVELISELKNEKSALEQKVKTRISEYNKQHILLEIYKKEGPRSEKEITEKKVDTIRDEINEYIESNKVRFSNLCNLLEALER